MRTVVWMGLLAGAMASPAHAQFGAPLPSQVAPRELRGLVDADTPRVAPLPPSTAIDARAADLHVTLSAVDVIGAFDDVAPRPDPFAAIIGRSASLADIQRAVAALQAGYDDAGYALVRIVLPPQTLRDGGILQVRVVDGTIESVQADGVPEAVRAAVEARLATLVGQRRLRWPQLERQVLLAGSIPGLRLGSALLPGTADDGVRLAVDGRFERTGGRLGADDALPASLGKYELNGNLVLNTPLGLGEQWLLSVTRGMGSAVHGRAPLDSTALGLVMPVGTTGFTLAPQAVRVTTAPTDSPGAPTSTGVFRRASLTSG